MLGGEGGGAPSSGIIELRCTDVKYVEKLPWFMMNSQNVCMINICTNLVEKMKSILDLCKK